MDLFDHSRPYRTDALVAQVYSMFSTTQSGVWKHHGIYETRLIHNAYTRHVISHRFWD